MASAVFGFKPTKKLLAGSRMVIIPATQHPSSCMKEESEVALSYFFFLIWMQQQGPHM